MSTPNAVSKVVDLITALIILPGSVLVIIPGIILYATQSMRLLGGLECPFVFLPLALGGFFLLAGLVLGIRAIASFYTVGEGTPAPWCPPRKFVIAGPYRYVRNPMLIAMILTLLGEAIVTCSLPILVWGIMFWVINMGFVVFCEEPDLMRRFGADYEAYSRNVGRWCPRIIPWKDKK